MVGFGVGVDIEETARFEGIEYLEKARSKTRIFTPKEIDYCLSKERPGQHFASRYAAKEAIYKALCDCGYKDSFKYNGVEIINLPNGEPSVNVLQTGLQTYCLRLSLARSEDKAVAFAVAENIKG